MHRSFLLLAALPAWLFSTAVWGSEIFVLVNGGQVEGKLLNPNQSPRRSYVVKTDSGGQITLTKSQVARVVRKSDVLRDYEKWLPKMPNTAEGNWKMAQWCRKYGLKQQRQSHLEQVLKFDPEQEDARHALGYSRVRGQWLNVDQWKQSRGYVRHLFMADEMLGPVLLTAHNLTYYQRLMGSVQAAIEQDRFMELYREKMQGWSNNSPGTPG